MTLPCPHQTVFILLILRPTPDITAVEDLGPYEIRLQNIGCKNRRFDRIVVQRMKHSPNANEIVENLGSCDPMPNSNNEILVALNLKRLRYWIGTEGVVINPWVQKLLGKHFRSNFIHHYRSVSFRTLWILSS